MKGKGNRPFRLKGLKEGSVFFFLNHSYSKYSEFPVKREANVLTTCRHVKGVPFVE